ncbi:Os08g0234100, partial [Oryza sativa Japonica Group]
SPNPPIYTFIRLHGGSVSSMSITEHFKKFFFKNKNHIPSMDMLLFENLLATLQGCANEVLKPDYHKF